MFGRDKHSPKLKLEYLNEQSLIGAGCRKTYQNKITTSKSALSQS